MSDRPAPRRFLPRRLISRRRMAQINRALVVQQLLVAIGGTVFPDRAAFAANTTTSDPTGMVATAYVQSMCIIVNVGTMNFGAFGVFDVGGSPSNLTPQTVTATATLSYACTTGALASLTANPLTVTLAGSAVPAHTLLAPLSTTAAALTTAGVALTADATTHTELLLGVITAQASTYPDSYSGTTVLTINY